MRIEPIGSIREINRNLIEIGRLQKSISSGSRLTSAADGPASLVLSEQFGAQLAALNQVGEDLSRVGNVLNTADGAFSQVGDLLSRGQSLALQAVGQSGAEQDATQGELDTIVSAVRRIGASTNFGGQNLTNGSQAITVQNANAAFSQIDIQRASEGLSPSTVTVNVQAGATHGQATGAIAALQAGDAQIQVTGSLGTATLDLAAGSTRADVAAAINGVKEQTGVEADATTGAIQASVAGSANFADIRSLSGSLSGVSDSRIVGTDVQATVNGIQAASQGNLLSFNGGGMDGRITLADGTGPGGYTFDVAGGGLGARTGTGPEDLFHIGIPSVLPGDLGRSASPSGLESVVAGGANSLSNPAGAARVFSAALDDLTRARGQLGAFQSNVVEPLTNSLQVTFENISAANSRVSDTDFATALSELTARRIRNEASVSFLTQAQRLNGQNTLRLLGS